LELQVKNVQLECTGVTSSEGIQVDMLDLYKKYWSSLFSSRRCRIALAYMEMGLHISLKMHFFIHTNVFLKTLMPWVTTRLN